MHVSIPTIGTEKFFEYHSEIRMRTIDVALSADLNDRAGTTETCNTKNNCSDFIENLNLTLIHLTLSNQGGNIFYC